MSASFYASYFVERITQMLDVAAVHVRIDSTDSTDSTDNTHIAKELLARAEGYLDCAMEASLINHHNDALPLQRRLNEVLRVLNAK